jgi:hypothetical protein
MLEIRVVTVSNKNYICCGMFFNIVECFSYVMEYSLHISYIFLTHKAMF